VKDLTDDVVRKLLGVTEVTADDKTTVEIKWATKFFLDDDNCDIIVSSYIRHYLHAFIVENDAYPSYTQFKAKGHKILVTRQGFIFILRLLLINMSTTRDIDKAGIDIAVFTTIKNADTVTAEGFDIVEDMEAVCKILKDKMSCKLTLESNKLLYRPDAKTTSQT
jgi:hypothetical protein